VLKYLAWLSNIQPVKFSTQVPSYKIRCNTCYTTPASMLEEILIHVVQV
jgi:hypothetical protein